MNRLSRLGRLVYHRRDIPLCILRYEEISKPTYAKTHLDKVGFNTSTESTPIMCKTIKYFF